MFHKTNLHRNVCKIYKTLICCLYYRAFASETTQFLAPYEASVKSRSEDANTPEVLTGVRPCLGSSASHVRIVST